MRHLSLAWSEFAQLLANKTLYFFYAFVWSRFGCPTRLYSSTLLLFFCAGLRVSRGLFLLCIAFCTAEAWIWVWYNFFSSAFAMSSYYIWSYAWYNQLIAWVIAGFIMTIFSFDKQQAASRRNCSPRLSLPSLAFGQPPTPTRFAICPSAAFTAIALFLLKGGETQ
jgi:hypothetical protein